MRSFDNLICPPFNYPRILYWFLHNAKIWEFHKVKSSSNMESKTSRCMLAYNVNSILTRKWNFSHCASLFILEYEFEMGHEYGQPKGVGGDFLLRVSVFKYLRGVLHFEAHIPFLGQRDDFRTLEYCYILKLWRMWLYCWLHCRICWFGTWGLGQLANQIQNQSPINKTKRRGRHTLVSLWMQPPWPKWI